jgi:hypothetical protein
VGILLTAGILFIASPELRANSCSTPVAVTLPRGVAAASDEERQPAARD